VDAEHQHQPGPTTLLETAGHDIEDGRTRREEQRQGGDDEQPKAGEIRRKHDRQAFEDFVPIA